MGTITMKSLWAYKRRLIGTIFAITLGVAFLAGTLLLSDTLSTNFNRLFTQADGSTSVVVRSATTVSSEGGQDARAGIAASDLGLVKSVPGVADAQPYLEGHGQLLGRDHQPIGGNGPPTTAANWVSDPSLNPYHLVSGRAPHSNNEVVINRGAATSGHLGLGSTTTLLTPQPVPVRVVGIATFGTADAFGSGTFTGMTLGAAKAHLTTDPATITEILVRATPGVSPDQLAARLRPALPAGAQAITGAQLATESYNAINSGFLGFLRSALLTFACIALVVAAFSIQNTFSILFAQRSREVALLRTLGATRRQVIRAGILETVAVGLAGSALGWLAGVGIAELLKAVFNTFGFALPAGGLVVKASSAVLAVVVGLAVTIVAGIAPSVRSSRVAPMAALRDLAAEPTRVSRRRALVSAAVTTVGIAIVIVAAIGGASAAAALGAALSLAGVIALGPVAARPSATVIGAPIAAWRGLTGRLARQNALRNPRRTAATASALLVGVSVVVLFTVVASSIKASASAGVARSLTADLVVSTSGYGGQAGGSGFSPKLASEIGRLPGVEQATGAATGTAMLAGGTQTVFAAHPDALTSVLNLGVTEGSLRDWGPAALGVSQAAADSHGWRIGSRVPITYPDGTRAGLRVAAIYDRADIPGDYLVSGAGWSAHTPQPVDSKVFVTLAHGASLGAVTAEVHTAVAPYGNPKVQDQAQYVQSAAQGVDTILGLIYVMLVLAIVIALMGIANTLSLSIHERTRELGMLRALGQTKAQTRAMIRWESVIISLFGTVGGVLLGTLFGWAMVMASSATTFSVPPAQLGIILVVGAGAGVLAGIRPARRASRLNVLAAIGTA